MQRSLIIAALAAVSILLLTEWVQFRDAHAPVAASPTPATPAATGAVPAAPDAGAVPDAPAPTATGVPVTATADTASSASAAPSTVDIVTDTLRLTVSLYGGNISGIALPRHLATLGASEQPFQLLEQSAERTYIAQTGLIGANGTDTNTALPTYTSASSRYELAADQNQLVVDLRLPESNGVSITKRYTLQRGEYVFRVDYLVENHSDKPWQAGLYGLLKRDSKPDPGANGGMFSIKPFLGFATHTNEKPYNKFTFENVAETPYDHTTQGGWIALVQHYFVSAWIPDATQNINYRMSQNGAGMNFAHFTAPLTVVPAGQSAMLGAQFYAGPKDQYRLRQISSGLELTVDYGWLWWIAQPLFALLHFFATGEAQLAGWSISFGNGIGNWGVAIILLTVLVKSCFFKLSATSYKSMAKMRKLQPKMQELRDRYGDDRQKLSQETMELYRREKVNPLGGCLPIVIQMPVFLALYWVLLESVELRHAPFFAWIDDLSVMDPYFVLPLLMGASMYFQQKLNPPPPDPMQAKVFQFMPIVFTVFFLFFPAGLVLYWLVNNLLSITQQWIITRRIEQGT